MLKIASYFEIDARAEMAYDLETNEPCEAYLQVATEHSRDLTTDEIEKVHQLHKRMVAEQTGIPLDYLKEISEDEYLRQTEDGE